jgi:hypothetical protein
MSEPTVNDAPLSNDKSTTTSRAPMVRSSTVPNTPPSPLATNPWYQNKFEFVCDIFNEFDHFFFINMIVFYSIAMLLKKKYMMNILICLKRINYNRQILNIRL